MKATMLVVYIGLVLFFVLILYFAFYWSRSQNNYINVSPLPTVDVQATESATPEATESAEPTVEPTLDIKYLNQ